MTKLRHATSKDMQELQRIVAELSKNMLKMAQWEAYQILSANPYILNEKMRQQILEQVKDEPLLNHLLRNLFQTHPL